MNWMRPGKEKEKGNDKGKKIKTRLIEADLKPQAK